MPSETEAALTRRDLLSLVGSVAGSAVMYQAMTSLGFAAESGYRGPIKLDGDAKNASVSLGMVSMFPEIAPGSLYSGGA